MRSFRQSQEYLARAEKTIPGGTQTYSKGKTQYPYGASPYFITRAQGSRVWDMDGNEYLDFASGLATITLGYNDPDVTRAVETQLKSGVIFTLPHPVEAQVAEKFVELVPCAEMVRFGKNGSDVTSAAIRLARAYTNRDHVVVCGYHGWQDWYIGSTSRNRGVPKVVRDLTHTASYNDAGSLRKVFSEYPNQIAGVILEPMSVVEPKQGFLEEVEQITHENGALLIFDEMITGFRLARGGAQELFGITPDLATFGKGLANGYPLSAVAGRAEVMKLLDDVYMSLTYAGETLSLAASLATLSKLQAEPVIESIRENGQRLKSGIQERIERHGVAHIFGISGHPAYTFVLFKDVGGYTEWQVRTLFLQEILERGILMSGAHLISYAHTAADVDRLLAVYDEVFQVVKQAIDGRTLERLLRCETLAPRFKIR